MAWLANPSRWNFTPPIIHRISSVAGTHDLSLINNSYQFTTDKSYVYKIGISNIDDDIWNTTYLELLTVSGSGIILNNYSNLNNMSQTDGYFYIWSKVQSNITENEHLTVVADESFTTPVGINNVKISETQWDVNGYSWVNDTIDPSLLYNRSYLINKNNVSPGWSLDVNDSSLIWFDIQDGVYSPRNKFGDEYIFKEINYTSSFINYPYFNLEFIYSKYYGPNYNDNGAGIRIFLSDEEPIVLQGNTQSDFNDFNDFLSRCEEVAFIGTTGSYGCNFYGLDGFKHLMIVASASSTLSTSLIRLSNIKISGGYHEGNNEIYSVSLPDFSTVINGATYSAYVGFGQNIGGTGTYSVSEINSKIGNGLFLSGKWENGVWNNGWREDTIVKEFYNIDLSVKVISNIKWRFRITGPKDSVSSFNVGDDISIGNIIGIDINEKRKLLKGSYKIVSKNDTGIDSRIGFIIVELETTFPLRRIEKDSNNHRIYITKNIWLSGAFLNGYFTGVWNYGLFKGYPEITEMYKTQWIDGIFEGGHFNSEKYISGSFSDTFSVNRGLDFFISGASLGLTFSQPHNLAVGDSILIDKDDKTVNPSYDGDATVVEVLDDYQIVTDKRALNIEINESGSIYTDYSDGLIQNMKFDSINISNKTMFDTFVSSSVFSYNSWIDVTFDTETAVNIGRPQTQINEFSRKSISTNNLYGYPTYDVLSSISKFRDSYSLESNLYKLGSKYNLYNDYVGDSSKFDKYFGPSNQDIELFIKQGWTFSVDPQGAATFSRAQSFTDPLIKGEELEVNAYNKGAVLDIAEPQQVIRNRTLEEIPSSRYTISEFEFIKSDSIDTTNEGTIRNTAYYRSPRNKTIKSGDFFDEPVIHFDNINKVYDYYEIVTGTPLFSGVDVVAASYLPVHENINHLLTRKKKKVEYFYNKTNLSMNFKGSGPDGISKTNVIINNLKIIEVDMIPFFKYFNKSNINTSIQIPYKGIAPYIDYTDNNFNFLDNINIGLDSISLLNSISDDPSLSGTNISNIPVIITEFNQNFSSDIALNGTSEGRGVFLAEIPSSIVISSL